jgi:hypothetical protein
MRGNNRMVFGPENSLWIGHSNHGWAGEKGLQRMRWKGADPFELHSMKITSKGFDLTFTKPVDAKLATRVENYAITRYSYSYHPAYGSPQRNKEAVTVMDVQLKSPTTIALELSDLIEGRTYELRLSTELTSAKDDQLLNRLAFYNALRLK